MEFRILGPLEVMDGNGVIEVKATKQRLILTVLALADGGEVSSDRLLREVWGENPPGGGLKTLQYHVSKLRDTLQPGREPGAETVVVTRPNGYALAVSPDCVDAASFERTVRDARRLLEFDPSQAAVRLREALDLWHGTLPIELLEMPVAGLEARRLIELRLTALEDRINADLASGRHAEVVPELQALVAEHPLRERLWAQLMVALYRCDRQAEALRSYQRLRAVLGDELGIEPSPDLRRLEDAMLLQEPDLDMPEGLRRPASLRGYELHERIGEGAFGVVWRAAQRSVEREVAIKVVRAEYSNRPGFVLGFQAEALRLATLQHPHIVPVFDFWRDPDGAYLVMQLMAEGSLQDVSVGTWEASQAIRVIEQLGLALAHAHSVDMVHGDLHPGNILFDGEGNGYLADFGLASFLSGGTSTPPEAFAAPEQLEGRAPDAASDVYSFGRLVFRLIAGANPPIGPLPALASVRSNVPGAVNGVLRRATDPDPSQRYADASEFLVDLRAALGDGQTVIARPRNPYKGLRAFATADAQDFFGRDAEVEDLLVAIRDHRLVSVVGPSGCGKSSLVRAGLIPALREGRIAGSDRWLHVEAYPGVKPVVALGEALRSVAVQQIPEASDPQWHPDRIVDLVHNVLPANADLVLFIDQFEELFTLCTDQAERIRFMDALLALLADPEGTTRVVLTLRADYYGLPLEYRPFGDLMRSAVVGLTPPGPEQLVQAITGPAAAVGLSVEPELIADIVADTTAEPGGLPLMEYTMTRLFDERVDGHLTLEAYRSSGGVEGALARWPEQIYRELPPQQQAAVETILVHLVTVDPSADRVTRRRVPLPELDQLGIPRSTVAQILERYGAARLITFDRDPRSRTPTVEVAHEALLEHWTRLAEWVATRRSQLILQRRLRDAAAEWEEANRDPGFLLQGTRLRQFDALLTQGDLPLTDTERDFLTVSRSAVEARRVRRRSIRRAIGASLAALAALALIFGVVALMQRNRAEGEADAARTEQERAEVQRNLAVSAQTEAERQTHLAQAQQLASSAIATLDSDPELSILLALEAVETSRAVDGAVLREAEEALHQAVSSNRLVSIAPIQMGGSSLAFSPEGDTAYVGAMFRGDIVTVSSGEVEAELPFPVAVVEIVGADGEWLAIADYNGALSIHDRKTLEQVSTLEGHTAWTTDMDASTDGMTLASISPQSTKSAAGESTAAVWDLSTGDQIASFPLNCEPPACPQHVSLSANGQRIAFGSTIYDVISGDLIGSWTHGEAVALVDDLNAVAVIDGNAALLVDIESGAVIETLPGHHADVTAVAVNGDESRIATGSQDGSVIVWRRSGRQLEPTTKLVGHHGPIAETEFSPDGRMLATVGGLFELPADIVFTWPENWELRVWDVTSTGPGEQMAVEVDATAVAFTPDGANLVAISDTSAISVLDASSGEAQRTHQTPGKTIRAVALSPDGSVLLAGGSTPSPNGGEVGWLTAMDIASGSPVEDLPLPDAAFVPEAVVFSGNGSHVAATGATGVHVFDTAGWDLEFSDTIAWDTVFSESDPADGRIYAAATFSPDGRLLVTQSSPYGQDIATRATAIWELESGDLLGELFVYPTTGKGAVSFSPDGRLLVTASGEGRPQIFEPYTRRQLGVLRGPASNAYDVTYSPDGSRIATAEADGTVRLWDATTGEEQLVLRGHQAAAASVVFNANGSRLASVSEDGVLLVWELDIDDLVRIAQSRVTRDLTDVECRIWVGDGCPPAPGVERLAPALSEAAGPVGIDESSWASAKTGGTWTEGPNGRGGEVALDTQSHRLFALNGLPAPSWRLDLDSGEWSEAASMPVMAGSEWPNATIGEVVYHPKLRLIVANRLDDGATLAYDVATDVWTEIAPPEPAFVGRYASGLVYDTDSDRIVLFGGALWGRTDEGRQVGLNDTWVLDAATGEWTEVTAALSPPPRSNHAVVYDTSSDRVVVFGGATGLGGDVLGDTWVYDTDTNTWAEVVPMVSPPGRADAAVWYDPVADAAFVFGGSADWSAGPPLPWMMLGGEELWAYDTDSGVWTLYRSDPNPGYRLASQAVFDSQSNEALLFAGEVYDDDRRFLGWFEDTWTYRHAAP